MRRTINRGRYPATRMMRVRGLSGHSGHVAAHGARVLGRAWATRAARRVRRRRCGSAARRRRRRWARRVDGLRIVRGVRNGMYCDGVETCAPGTTGASARGCVAGTAPCGPPRRASRTRTRAEAARSTTATETACPAATPTATTRTLRAIREYGTLRLRRHDEDCDDTTFGAKDDDGDGVTDARCCNGARAGSTATMRAPACTRVCPRSATAETTTAAASSTTATSRSPATRTPTATSTAPVPW